jgi:hypothetical protein
MNAFDHYTEHNHCWKGRRGSIDIKHIIIPLLGIDGVHFGAQNHPCCLGKCWIMIYNTPTMPSMIHALQGLAIYMQQYHKYILPRAKMDIFVRAKFASSSQCKRDSNAPIFSLIGHELHELREFYKRCPEMEIFRGTPSMLIYTIVSFHCSK